MLIRIHARSASVSVCDSSGRLRRSSAADDDDDDADDDDHDDGKQASVRHCVTMCL